MAFLLPPCADVHTVPWPAVVRQARRGKKGTIDKNLAYKSIFFQALRHWSIIQNEELMALLETPQQIWAIALPHFCTSKRLRQSKLEIIQHVTAAGRGNVHHNSGHRVIARLQSHSLRQIPHTFTLIKHTRSIASILSSTSPLLSRTQSLASMWISYTGACVFG
jgi:hypothetical protein